MSININPFSLLGNVFIVVFFVYVVLYGIIIKKDIKNFGLLKSLFIVAISVAGIFLFVPAIFYPQAYIQNIGLSELFLSGWLYFFASLISAAILGPIFHEFAKKLKHRRSM